MSKVLFSLDLATATGFALIERGKPPRFGTKIFQGDVVDKHIQLQRWLNETRQVFQYDGVAFEEGWLPQKTRSGKFNSSRETVRLLWGMTCIAAIFAREHKLPCIGISPSEGKLRLTGSGNAPPDHVERVAMMTWGWDVANPDEAAAGAIGIVAYDRLWPKGLAPA